VLGVVHANIFLYSISFGLSLPVLPYLTETLGADPIQYGYLQTWFSLMQLLVMFKMQFSKSHTTIYFAFEMFYELMVVRFQKGSPLLGMFGDKYGSKAAFLVSIGASGIATLTY